MEDIIVCGQDNYNRVHSPTDWVLFAIAFLTGMVYVSAVFQLRRRNVKWMDWNAGSFLIGTGLLLVAFFPPLMASAHESIKAHMLQHLLMGMFAPIFLVLGAPITLALKILPVRRARLVTRCLRSGVLQIFGHPLTALILNVGGMFLLYLTPLYEMSRINPVLHYMVHIHFVLAGYLFAWAIIGLEPVSKRSGFNIKVAVTFLSIALHAFLSKFMYAYLYPANTPHPVEDIRQAAQLMYYWGDLSELMLVVILFYFEYQRRKSIQHNISLQTTRFG